ncbi:MAG: hypothetical protein AAB870_02505 [Patescibacteria group bacterium]
MTLIKFSSILRSITNAEECFSLHLLVTSCERRHEEVDLCKPTVHFPHFLADITL